MAVLTALALAGCAAPDGERADPAATVRALIAADGNADLTRVLACYEDDVVWLPPGAAPVAGKDAVASRYRRMFEAYVPRLAVTVEQSGHDGALAFVRGRTHGVLVPRAGGPPVAVDDVFLALLRTGGGAGGRWRITHLMWHPAAAGPPGAAR